MLFESDPVEEFNVSSHSKFLFGMSTLVIPSRSLGQIFSIAHKRAFV